MGLAFRWYPNLGLDGGWELCFTRTRNGDSPRPQPEARRCNSQLNCPRWGVGVSNFSSLTFFRVDAFSPAAPSLSEDIKSMPVAEIADQNSILWLWTTNAHLRVAFEVVEAWGFEYRTLLT